MISSMDPAAAPLPKPKRKRRTFLKSLLLIFVVFVVWALVGGGPFSQWVRSLAGWKADVVVLDKSFTVRPRVFRYYKFSVPEGAKETVVGHFESAAVNEAGASAGEDNSIEVLIMTETEFATWQTGGQANVVFESGKVAKGALHTALPVAPVSYYLVFSNKTSPTTAKAVKAEVSLRERTWLRVLVGSK
jgi:hypothetical protein